MLFSFASASRRSGHFLLGAPLAAALLLGPVSAHAQVVPTPAPAQKPAPKNVVYFLDGQQTTAADVEKIDANEIGSIDIIKGANQQRIFGSLPAASDGVAVVTTKAKANSPEVLAFNKRIYDVMPLVPATPAQNAAVAAVQAYLTKTYPTAKLQMVGPVKGQADRYQAIFEEGGKRLQLFFDGQGQPVKQ
jgi:hypothetical protein